MMIESCDAHIASPTMMCDPRCSPCCTAHFAAVQHPAHVEPPAIDERRHTAFINEHDDEKLKDDRGCLKQMCGTSQWHCR